MYTSAMTASVLLECVLPQIADETERRITEVALERALARVRDPMHLQMGAADERCRALVAPEWPLAGVY